MQMTSIHEIDAGYACEIEAFDQELADMRHLQPCELVPLAEPLLPDDIIAYQDEQGSWWAVRADVAAADYLETHSLDARPSWLINDDYVCTDCIDWSKTGADELRLWCQSHHVAAVMIG